MRHGSRGGQKPKPTALLSIEGRRSKVTVPENEPQPQGALAKPPFLAKKRRASQLWDEYAPILYWLTSADSHTLASWCVLTAELERDSKAMTASRIGQMRQLAAELGMTPSARARIGSRPRQQSDPAKKYLSKRA